MKLALLSDGTVAGTRIVAPETGDEVENVAGHTLDRAIGEDGRPLPYMLLNLTVRIEDGPGTPSVRPLDMPDDAA